MMVLWWSYDGPMSHMSGCCAPHRRTLRHPNHLASRTLDTAHSVTTAPRSSNRQKTWRQQWCSFGCFWIISMLFNAALSIAEPWLLSNSGHFQEELAQAWHKHGTSMAHQAGLCWLNSDLTLAATSALPASRKQWTAFSQWSMAAAGPPGPLPSQMPAALSYLRHLDSKEKPTKQT